MRVALVAGLLLVIGCDSTRRGGECLDVKPGAKPVGYRLEGSVQVKETKGSATSDVRISTKVYFPRGWVAGAPVNEGTVNSSLGFGPISGGFRTSGLKQVTFRYEQANPNEEIKVHVTMNMADASSDIVRPGTGEGTLCVVEALDETPTLTPSGPVTFPSKYVNWESSAPLDAASLGADTVLLANGQPVPGTFSVDGRLLFSAEKATPPNATLELKVGSLKSVLGKPAKATPFPESLVTTATVTDLTFTEPPPEGAAVSYHPDQLGIGGGVLRVGIADSYQTRIRAYYSLIALGDPGAASMAHLKARMDCKASEQHSTSIALMAETGAHSWVQVACAEEFADVTVPVPESGPLWLVVVNGSAGTQPQSAPVGPGDALLVDEISFE